MEYRFDNYILKAFLASGLLAVVIMVLALGLIQLFRYGPGLPISITLILAAIAFVLSASFFERYEVGSIMWSMLVSSLGGDALWICHLCDNIHDPSQLSQAQPGRD